MSDDQDSTFELTPAPRRKKTDEEIKARKAAYQRAYLARNKDAVNAKIRAKRAANPEKYRAYAKASQERNKEKIPSRSRAYYLANKEERLAYQKAYHEARRAECAAKSKAYYEANKEQCRAKYAAFYEENKERMRAEKKIWREANPDVERSLKLKSMYGITLDDFKAMQKAQDDRCLCCKTLFGLLKPHRPCVDHCHRTGKVRGLLCNLCNGLLGHAHDSPEVLRRCAEYLERLAK